MNNFDFSFLTEYKGLNLDMILISFVIGIIIASGAIVYHQMFLGSIVRTIISKKALSPEGALTIEELGFNPKNIFVKFALRNNSTFRKTVLATGDSVKRFYIPEERRIREEIKFRKKGNSAAGIIFATILFVAVAFVLLTVIPWFVDEIKSIFL